MASTKPVSVWDLERNDLEGAIAFVEARGGDITPDESQVLQQLQDDPAELRAAMRRIRTGRSRPRRDR
jgi:hypothetical protein